jgi:hypothetical protein
MSSRFKTVLAKVLVDAKLSAADRAHLTRWATDGWADDVAWRKIEADAEAHGLIPSESAHETVIREALFTRDIAEGVSHGDDPLLRERKEQRDLLLELADKADDLAKYYAKAEKFSGIAMFFARFLKPVAELRRWHEQEAVLLRQRAGREPKPTTFISRQSGGKKKRLHSRKYNAFMFLMADQMRYMCGKPHYDAVATLTNIAFSGAKVTADDVRNACRSTRRRRRRQTRVVS